jgi:RNA polymerase sigma factor (sigma-70 family)
MAFTTRFTVIEKIRTGDEIGWEEFVETYKPLIILRGRDRGLLEHEITDLVQDVILNLFETGSILKFDRQYGKFRNYLKAIIDRRAVDIFRRRREREHSLSDLMDEGFAPESPDFEALEQNWTKAWYQHILDVALEAVAPEVSQKTYDAFRMLVVDGKSAQAVADAMGISTNSVYVAKHRVQARIRSIVKQLEPDMEMG